MGRGEVSGFTREDPQSEIESTRVRGRDPETALRCHIQTHQVTLSHESSLIVQQNSMIT